MEIDKVFSSDVDGVADNLFSAVKNSVSEIKAMQQRKAAENVQLVIQALKKIESDLQDKFDGVTTVIEKRVATIKDGRDGLDGRNGRDGKDGRPGRDGAPGARGPAGVPGTNGRDGEDGVSVTDARIDFDGSLIISLSSGREINVGEVVAPDLAEKIKVITNGGGTSQSVLDSLASLQAQINALSNFGAVNYVGTWNADTNTPTIVNGTGDKGDYYVVSVAGATNIDGQTLWGVGDWIIFNGVVWQRVDGGSTGNFTDLSASGVVTLSGGTADSVLYLNGSKVVSSTSNFGFNGATQVTLNFGSGTNGWNAAYSRYLVGKTTLAGASSSSISHLTSNLHDTGAGTGTWQYMLSVSTRGSVLTQFNGTLSWAATALAGTGGNTATVSNILQASYTGAVTLNSSGRPGSLINYGTAEITDAVTLSAGTANGVAYLNGSKVLTTGSALTFDTARLSFIKASNGRAWSADGDDLFAVENSTSANADFRTSTTGATYLMFSDTDARARGYVAYLHGSDSMPFAAAGSEQMRLTSTGLGIGTSSPAAPLSFASATGQKIRFFNGVSGYGIGVENSEFRFVTDNSAVFTWGIGTYASPTEAMRLNASGNLGIGTSSPLARLHVSQLSTNTAIGTSGAQGLYMTNPGTTVNAFSRIDFSGSSNGATASIAAQFTNYVTGATDLVFGTYGGAAILERMRLDASGNLGLGVTPSAWASGQGAMQLKLGGLSAWALGGVNGYIYSNAYYDGSTNRYVNNGTACSYAINNGTGIHAWFTAASGTAGNAISFTQAMTLDASGNLLVGTASSSLMGGNSLKIDGGTDTTGGQYSFLAYHNNAAYYFGLNNNGYVQASAVYGRTTASAANVNVDASGYITRSTSARKYKQDIRDIEEMDISLLRPVRYKSKCESDDQTKDHLGVIADEAADAGFEELVTRGADGEVEGFQYERLTVVLLKELQSLRARVAQLEGNQP